MLQMLWIHMNADRVRWGRRNGVQCFVSPLSDLFYPTFLHGPALYKNPQMPDSPASKIYKYSQTSFKWIPRPRRMPRCPYCSYRIAWYQTRLGAATSVWQGWHLLFLLPGDLDVSEPGNTMQNPWQRAKKGRNGQITAFNGQKWIKTGVTQPLPSLWKWGNAAPGTAARLFTLQTLSQTCKLWKQFRPVLKVTTPRSVNWMCLTV